MLLRTLVAGAASFLLIWSIAWTLAVYQDRLAIVDLVGAMEHGALGDAATDFQRLDNAILLDPVDADYRIHRVYFSRLRCQQAGKAACCTVDHREAYRRILRLRPLWSDAWLDYADCLTEVGSDHTEAAARALDRALQLAPVDYGTTRRALAIGFKLLDVMNAAQRRRFSEIVQRVLARYPGIVIQRAIEAGRVTFLRPLLMTEAQRKLLWKRQSQVQGEHR